MTEKKKHENSVTHTLSSLSTSDCGGETSQNIHFYQDFLKYNSLNIVHITSTDVVQMYEGKNTKPYAVYTIKVITEDIEYIINRRYSAFRHLFQQLQKKLKLNTLFPKKTYFSSNLNPQVLEYRKIELNKFIEQLLKKQNQEEIIEFYQFLGLRNHYSRQKLNIAPNPERKPDQEVMYDLLTQLNQQPQNIEQIFQLIDKQIFQTRARLSNQVIRRLFIGLGKKKGILNIALESSQNIFICLKGLELIIKLLNFEQNRDAQSYIKIFVGCPISSLKINNKKIIISNTSGKINYFKLIQLFFRRDSQLNHKGVLKYLFQEDTQTIKEFQYWCKSRQKNSLNVQLFLQIPSPPKDKQKKKLFSSTQNILKDVFYENKKDWIPIKEIHSKQYCILVQKKQNTLLKFIYKSKIAIQYLNQIFLNSTSWNSQINNVIQNQKSKTITYDLNLSSSQQILQPKFKYQIDQINGTLLKKPTSLLDQDSFFQFIQVSKVKEPEDCDSTLSQVKIMISLQNQKVKNYFQKQLTGQTSYLIDSLKNLTFTNRKLIENSAQFYNNASLAITTQ